MSLIYIHWTTVSTHGIEKWCEFHHILVEFVQLCFNHLWHQEFHHILVVPPMMCTSYWALCVGLQFKLHDMSQKNKQEKNHQGGPESNTSRPAIPFHFLLLWKLRMAWEHNWTECFGDVRHLHHHRRRHHLYHNFSSSLTIQCLWIHFGLQKNVKSNGIQFNKTKGLPTITEWNVVPHMEDAEKGSSSQVHRHTGEKKTKLMLYFAMCKPIVGFREREERTSSQKMIPNETEASQRKASPAELHSPRRLSRSLWKGTDFVKFMARGNTAPKDFIIFTRCFSAPAPPPPPPPQSPQLSVSLQNPPQSLHLSLPNNNTRVPKPATHSSIHLPTIQSSTIHLPTSHPSTYLPTNPSSIQLPTIHPSIHQLGLFPHRLWNLMQILSIIFTTCGQQ